MARQTEILSGYDPAALGRAADLLRSGGLVAFPTDTVYGLAARAWDAAAVARIYRAKARPAEKAIPVLAATLRQIEQLTGPLSPAVEALAAHFWPGPLTVVLPCRAALPEIVLAGMGTVAVRIPDHPLALQLFRQAGEPLAVTSANLSGHANPLTADEVLRQLAGRIDAVLDGGCCPGGAPSTVVDLTTGQPAILRLGPVSEAAIRAALCAV